MKKCPLCKKGHFLPVDDVVHKFGKYTLTTTGERCTFCKEETIGGEEIDQVHEFAKKHGFWGKTQQKLTKNGRKITVPIPSDLKQEMNLKGDEDILISKKGKNKILIEIE